MAAAVLTAKPLPIDLPYMPLVKKPLPAGRPREWYIAHNRRLKAMRLAIALLDSGVYRAEQADNRRIRTTADLVGVHPPSDITCHMVRALMRYSR
ncbi:hypothetical protein DY218_13065 [Streptomyces triticagri]|uniref:Uncharacterized protein n=1 Tax=Streptomyces triticagri TaxID=2293568 RepID=A0A372M5N9_9ACTN|nr:hypothetical protein [Streptomyces triticagri]RFU86262.1 hypothetical protein DY218_13065 [Streptomyces triticagri]